MPQSLSSLYAHLVFSTKHRAPMLADGALRADLHAYLGGIARTLKCEAIRINGVEDHVHLLINQARTVCAADLVKELKRVSTEEWMRKKGHADFFWQAGYGVFSVSKSNVPEVAKYIEEQEQHHKKMTFQEEYRAFLRKHDMDWDEAYVWD